MAAERALYGVAVCGANLGGGGVHSQNTESRTTLQPTEELRQTPYASVLLSAPARRPYAYVYIYIYIYIYTVLSFLNFIILMIIIYI